VIIFSTSLHNIGKLVCVIFTLQGAGFVSEALLLG